jgi:hypothetical protein
MASEVSTGGMMVDALTRPVSGMRPVAYGASGNVGGALAVGGVVLVASAIGSIVSGMMLGAIVGAIRSCDSYRPRE